MFIKITFSEIQYVGIPSALTYKKVTTDTAWIWTGMCVWLLKSVKLNYVCMFEKNYILLRFLSSETHGAVLLEVLEMSGLGI